MKNSPMVAFVVLELLGIASRHFSPASETNTSLALKVMLDEDGYMSLKIQPRNRDSMHCSRDHRVRDVSRSSHRCKISPWILGAACALLGLAVIVLSIFMVHGVCHKRETGEASNASDSGIQERLLECYPCSGEHVDLKKRLCGPPTEKAECKLCPANWVPQKERCYWFSEGTKTWHDSQDDCTNRGGHFLVIQDTEEMVDQKDNGTQYLGSPRLWEFIKKNIQGEYRFWIGLHISPKWESWSWIDGSLYNQTILAGSHSKAGISCAVVQASQIRSEMCSDEFKWICEMDTILL